MKATPQSALSLTTANSLGRPTCFS